MINNIKLRAWDKNKNTFLQYSCYFNHLDFNKFTCFDRFFELSEENIIIQQFTTLKDSNNKEIYDGDIIEWSENIDWTTFIPEITYKPIKYRGVIKLDLVNGTLVDIKGIGTDINTLYKDLSPANGIKVIGNIMENLELLK